MIEHILILLNLLGKKRDGLHRLSVQLNSLVLIMGLCLIGLSDISL